MLEHQSLMIRHANNLTFVFSILSVDLDCQELQVRNIFFALFLPKNLPLHQNGEKYPIKMLQR